MPLSRVFVANRGEIAVRIIRACQSLGLETVLGVSEADRDSLGARLADRAVCIGPARSALSYLNANALVAAALGTGCDALHPGYGFLSERSDFAALCTQHDLRFVGPEAEHIQQMGNKLEARRLAREYGVPLAEGSAHIQSHSEAKRVADKVGYPVLLKAAAGGGGRGIRIVREPEELRSAFENATAEAKEVFGDGALYIERYIENARHIEVQVLADSYGNVLHLGERDCSLQRRYQKMVEESPALGLREEIRSDIRSAAVRLAESIGYQNAGTVEFIYDQDQEAFYFLEMNTRVQVEHPVTEEITGRDIVAEQLRVAGGEALDFVQEDVRFKGAAIECRINAEAPQYSFRPSPGLITKWIAPQGSGVRLDTHCYEGYMVPPFYDSLLGKLIVHDEDRDAAILGMRKALGEFHVEGVDTTAPFLNFVLAHEDYKNNVFTTRWLEHAVLSFGG